MILGLAVKYERPVSVGNKVVLGVTATKDTSIVLSVIDVKPFMRQIEHVMYISTVTNFRPFNLTITTDDDFRKFDIVMDNIQVEWNNLLQSGEKIVNIQGASNQGSADTAFGLLSNGDEIGKFLIIGSK
tara:strand:+ start:1876 stop:2262 length:387 start_codon:yes stop_codon:yes gene_type:complete